MIAQDKQIPTYAIPAHILLSRFEKHREEILQKLLETPRWNLRRRWALAGAAGAYANEIDQLLRHHASWSGLSTIGYLGSGDGKTGTEKGG